MKKMSQTKKEGHQMKKKINNEDGSATIEFLAMVPLVFLIMMILWQFLVAGYAAIIAQSALNEAAKTYAVTEDITDATSSARNLVNKAGGNIQIMDLDPMNNGNNHFTLRMHVNLDLVFIPDSIAGYIPKVSFTREISGRVME